MTDLSADYGPNRSAPHAVEAEEAVLGCVLINPDAYFEVSAFLRPEDFYLHKNRWVWNAFVDLHEQRLPIDIITVSEELERHNQLAETGGAAYLTQLINSVPTSLHAEAYGRLVEREALRRRLIEAATQVAKLAYEEGRDIGEVVNDAEAAVFAVSERRLAKELAPIKEAISQYYDRIKYLFEHRDELLGVPTGFIDLDKLLGGLQQSDLLIIAGRPGSGKTGLMLNVAKNAALTYKKHVAVFSLEMSNDQLVQRLIAQETGIDSQRLRLGDIHDNEWPLFVQAANVLSDAQIFLDDTPALTPNQLRSKCRRLDQEYGLDLVIVDYLQLMQGDGRTENRVQEVSSISRGLKQLARELNIPVLAGAQLSRAVEQRQDKRPVLSDLRESGCLAGDTLISLANGERRAIQDLVGSEPEVVTLNGWQVTTGQVSRVWLTGHRPIFKLTTQTGRVIRATGNHKFRVLEGWRPLNDLRLGDRIGLVYCHAGCSGRTASFDQSTCTQSASYCHAEFTCRAQHVSTQEPRCSDCHPDGDCIQRDMTSTVAPEGSLVVNPSSCSEQRASEGLIIHARSRAKGLAWTSELADHVSDPRSRAAEDRLSYWPAGWPLAHCLAMDIQPAHSHSSEGVDGLTTRGPSGATVLVTSGMRSRRQGDSLSLEFLWSDRAARGMCTQGDNMLRGYAQVSCVETRLGQADFSRSTIQESETDVFRDTIASIEPDGEADVYDMTVPGTHNFVANGIVVHNSLEQDSDIVMFIHRPDMYAADSAKTNIADIIVAKHRNGPTADVQLVFRGALTKFENAETRHVDLRQV